MPRFRKLRDFSQEKEIKHTKNELLPKKTDCIYNHFVFKGPNLNVHHVDTSER